MTTKELSAHIGRHGWTTFKGMHILMQIHDTRMRYGEVDYLVQPVAGMGTAWVSAGGFAFQDKEDVNA